VSRRFRRIEHRIGLPHLVDVLDPQPTVLEQMRGLIVDLERIGVVEEVEVEQLTYPTYRITFEDAPRPTSCSAVTPVSC
jgi:hypothetical protein